MARTLITVMQTEWFGNPEFTGPVQFSNEVVSWGDGRFSKVVRSYDGSTGLNYELELQRMDGKQVRLWIKQNGGIKEVARP